MKIILSPAKKMNINTDSGIEESKPLFIDTAEIILSWLKKRTFEELKRLWSCSDRIAEENIERLKHADLFKNQTPAVLAYEGIAYQYLAAEVFEDKQLEYVRKHLFILSAFYGALRAFDGIIPYRLEMQAKAAVGGYRDLYELWSDRLYRTVIGSGETVINLASGEYSKCIEKYLQKNDRYISIIFCEKQKGRFVTKGTYAKMARGEMVRFMAENNITKPEDIKSFDRLGYAFIPCISSDDKYVF